MAKKSDTLNHERERRKNDHNLRRDEYLKALRRLREIGEKLPTVDAAAVIRESRDLAEQDSR